MKFIDLFAGIGGFRLGMEAADHECIAFCEIDKFARASYKAIFDTEGEIEFHDITRVSDESVRGIGSVDIICGGFPCQAFSIAGKRAGFKDTRGTLFFEIARFASILRPKYLFLENVTGLLNHNDGDTFETILGALDELGYDAEWQVFNSKNFGVPQNRERVFIIGHLRGAGGRAIFPFGGESETTYCQQSKINVVGTTLGTGAQGTNSRHLVYDTDGLMSCLDATMYKQPKQIVVPSQDIKVIGKLEPNFNQSGCVYDPGGRVGKQSANTLLTGEEQGVVTPNFRIRKLTPRECWRLQGFPDWAFDKAQEVNSKSQLYKQAGNSVTVNVIEAIAKRLGTE